MLTKFFTALQGYKTYMVCAIAILSALLAYANHQLGIVGLAQAILAACGAMSMRAGIAKVENKLDTK